MAEAAVKRTSGRGRFITFEGGEGSGKSTQIKPLAERLEAAKLRTIVTREPGGSPGAEIIRHLVLSGMGKLLGPDAETLLFAAARDDHVRTVIEPALNQGIWVLVRPLFGFDAGLSGHARQGGAGGAQRDGAGHDRRPQARSDPHSRRSGRDRPAARGGAARRGAPDRFEAEDVKFHQELRDAYRQIAAGEPQRCVLIDATADPGTVAASIWTALRDRLFAASAGNVANAA